MNLSWGQGAQWLALAEYAVLLPNPRGGYGHGEHFADAVRRAVGKDNFGDVMAMVEAAVAAGIAMGTGVSGWGLMVQTSDVPNFERELGGSAP